MGQNLSIAKAVAVEARWSKAEARAAPDAQPQNDFLAILPPVIEVRLKRCGAGMLSASISAEARRWGAVAVHVKSIVRPPRSAQVDRRGALHTRRAAPSKGRRVGGAARGAAAARDKVQGKPPESLGGPPAVFWVLP